MSKFTLKGMNTLQVAAVSLLLFVVIVVSYGCLVISRPNQAELGAVVSGVTPVPDISSVDKTLAELNNLQIFGPVPISVTASEVGRTEPFSNF